MCVAKRLSCVQGAIAEQMQKSKRNQTEVTLIAVSKTMPTDTIMEAYNAGQRVFGENKVQELLTKKKELPSDIVWHLIGHLQTNKVSKIVGEAELIHSVDSLKLLLEINKTAQKKGIVQSVLLEVNVAEEQTKSGFLCSEIPQVLSEIKLLDNIKIEGLMTVAPRTNDPEDNRKFFKELYQLFVDIRNKSCDNICMKHLSMGMSGDYLVAIDEGATFVRVGTGIFGNRSYGQENN